MSLDRVQVIDALQGAAKAAWGSVEGGAYSDRVKYENVSKSPDDVDAVPFSGNDPWIRTTIRHIPGLGKTSLSNQVGLRRYDRRGVMIVQVFSLKGAGLPGTLDLPKVIRDAYEGKSLINGLVIRNVDVQEIGESGNWYQTNVSFSFEYDELK